MKLSFASSAMVALFEGLRAQIDLGGAATLEIYAGAQPGGGNAISADSTTLLGVITLASPCGIAQADGLHLIPASAQATGTGVPSWARLRNGQGDWVMDGDAGAAGTDNGVFTLTLTAGSTVYPGGDLLFAGGVIGF